MGQLVSVGILSSVRHYWNQRREEYKTKEFTQFSSSQSFKLKPGNIISNRRLTGTSQSLPENLACKRSQQMSEALNKVHQVRSVGCVQCSDMGYRKRFLNAYLRVALEGPWPSTLSGRWCGPLKLPQLMSLARPYDKTRWRRAITIRGGGILECWELSLLGSSPVFLL